MVLIQNPACLRQIDVLDRLSLPRQREHEIKIIADHALLGAALAENLQPAHFLERRLADVIRHAGLLDARTVILFLLPAFTGSLFGSVIALFGLQFCLNLLQLLAEHLLSVVFIITVGQFLLYLRIPFDGLFLLDQRVKKHQASLALRIRLQVFVFLIRGNAHELAQVYDQRIQILVAVEHMHVLLSVLEVGADLFEDVLEILHHLLAALLVQIFLFRI